MIEPDENTNSQIKQLVPLTDDNIKTIIPACLQEKKTQQSAQGSSPSA